jgi:hypothetical protein
MYLKTENHVLSECLWMKNKRIENSRDMRILSSFDVCSPISPEEMNYHLIEK